MTVHDFPSERMKAQLGALEALQGSGGPPYDGGMELTDRVGNLETDMKDVRDRLGRVEVKLDTFSTKADLADAKADLVKWIVGTAIGLGVAGITVMTFVLNNAIPRVQPAAAPAQAPIIINVPAAPAAQAPALAASKSTP